VETLGSAFGGEVRHDCKDSSCRDWGWEQDSQSTKVGLE